MISRINNQCNINFFSNDKILKSHDEKKENIILATKPEYGTLPDTRTYLAFLGTNLNLKDTLLKLDEQTPEGIKTWCENIVKMGNPLGKTLIDVHRGYYDKLADATSIEQVKADYPGQFDEVLSDEVLVREKGSLFDDIKNGKLESLNNDEDLALQFLKLYWAEGFSLNDIKEKYTKNSDDNFSDINSRYPDGRAISGIMDSLNIPKRNISYAKTLKLSDKDYNERFAKILSEKVKLGYAKAYAKKILEGEDVYNKDASKIENTVISDAFIEDYILNPDRADEIIKKSKDFFDLNPEKRIRFQKVLTRAWSSNEGKSVRKDMSRFMKKAGISIPSDSQLSEKEDMPTAMRKNLKDFWQNSDRSKQKFSTAMKNAWAKVKEEENKTYKISVLPKGYIEDIKLWAEKNGINTSKTDFRVYINNTERMPQYDFDSTQILQAYIDAKEYPEDLLASSFQLTLLNMLNSLEKDDKYSKKGSNYKSYIDTLKKCLDKTIFLGENNGKNRDMRQFREISTSDIRKLYSDILSTTLGARCEDLLPLYEKCLDGGYENAKHFSEQMEKGIKISLDPNKFYF